jgi:hypothetical protein
VADVQPRGQGAGATVCAHCEEQPAGAFCQLCGEVSFCLECDAVLHRAVKLRQHVRQRTWQGDDHDHGHVPPAVSGGLPFVFSPVWIAGDADFENMVVGVAATAGG